MSLTSKISQLKNDTDAAEQRASELLQLIYQMKEESFTQVQELGESQRKLKLKTMELEKVTKLYESVQSKVSGLERNKNEAEYANANFQTINDQRDEMYESSRIMKEEIYELDSRIKQLESKKKVLQNEAQKSESRFNQLTTSHQTLSSKIDELNSQMSNLDNGNGDQDDSLYSRIREIESELLEVSVNRENFQRKHISLQATMNKTLGLIEHVQKELHEMENELEGFH